MKLIEPTNSYKYVCMYECSCKQVEIHYEEFFSCTPGVKNLTWLRRNLKQQQGHSETKQNDGVWGEFILEN